MNDCISIFNGEFELLRLTPDLYDEAEELLTHMSKDQEFLCLITNLRDSPEATIELRRLIRHILSHGISFGIRQVATGRIVAAVCCIIFNQEMDMSYYDIIGQFRSPNMVRYRQLLEAIENSYDMFKEWQVDSVIEVEYMATLPEFRYRGLAGIMGQHVIDFGRLMSQGRLPQEVYDQLSKESQARRPKLTCTIATSSTSLNFVTRLGLQVVHRWKISELKSWGGNIVDPSDKEDNGYAEFHVIKY